MTKIGKQKMRAQRCIFFGSVIDTLFAMGLLGTRTYEKPSPHPVGSADPVTASWHFPFIAEINARVVFHGAVRT